MAKERWELYEGSVALTRNDQHRYWCKVGDERALPIPNVTTILGQKDKSSGLVPWAAGLAADWWRRVLVPGVAIKLTEAELDSYVNASKWAHRRNKDTAAAVGSIVHDYAQRRLVGDEVDYPSNPKALLAAEGFERWLAKHSIKPLHIERPLVSLRNWYAGTVDFIGEIDGVLTLADFKTSKNIYDEVMLQTAGYQAAAEEELGIEIEQRAAIHFDKETGSFTYAVFEKDRFEIDFGCFMALHQVWNWNKTAYARVQEARAA